MTPLTLRSIHRAVRSIYRFPQNTAGCQRCWQVSSRYAKGFSSVIYYTWAADGGSETILWMVNFNTFCKLRSQAPVLPPCSQAPVQLRCWWDRIARPVQLRCWWDRIARPVQNGDTAEWHSACGTKHYITGTNNNATYILWEHCFVTHCYRTGTMIKPGTLLKHVSSSSVPYTT